MAYNDPNTIYSRDSYVERDRRPTGSSVGIGVVVGGLVVAVLVLFWMFGGTGSPTTDSAGEPAVIMDGSGETTVNPNPATDQTAPAGTAPEDAPAAPENGLAPADGTAVGD